MLTPLKTFVKNMLTHVHKVIHLVVGTFEQGLETSLAECPLVSADSPTVPSAPVQKRQGFTECIGHWSKLDRSVRSVEVVKTLASVFDQTLDHFVTGCWLGASGPADVAAQKGDSV